MNLDRIIAVRNNKTVYRDGDRCLKVFNEGYSKADVPTKHSTRHVSKRPGSIFREFSRLRSSTANGQ